MMELNVKLEEDDIELEMEDNDRIQLTQQVC